MPTRPWRQVLDALTEIAFEPEFLPSRIEKERKAVIAEAQVRRAVVGGVVGRYRGAYGEGCDGAHRHCRRAEHSTAHTAPGRCADAPVPVPSLIVPRWYRYCR